MLSSNSFLGTSIALSKLHFDFSFSSLPKISEWYNIHNANHHHKINAATNVLCMYNSEVEYMCLKNDSYSEQLHLWCSVITNWAKCFPLHLPDFSSSCTTGDIQQSMQHAVFCNTTDHALVNTIYPTKKVYNSCAEGKMPKPCTPIAFSLQLNSLFVSIEMLCTCALTVYFCTLSCESQSYSLYKGPPTRFNSQQYDGDYCSQLPM